MAFNNPVVGGQGGELIRESIKSPDFQAGVQGWIIRRDGSAEFNDITIRGGAIVGGSITIGPEDGPQVVIDSDEFQGFIDFPTNSPYELTPAYIQSLNPDSDPAFSLDFNIHSATTVASHYSFVDMSSNRQDGLGQPSVLVGANDPDLTPDATFMRVVPGTVDFVTDAFEVGSDIMIEPNLTAGNFVMRVIRGKVGTGTTTTTIGTTDTEITSSDVTSVRLENGYAYRVDYRLYVQKTSGTAAAGTQSIDWKLWDGAVGSGTQLGPLIRRAVDTATNNLRSPHEFSFVFQYTGTTGSKTLRLSGDQSTGTDTVQGVVNDAFFMTVTSIGRPSNIINL